MGGYSLYRLPSCVSVFIYVVFFVEISTGLSSSKRHPYEFVKPLSSDSDSMQGPSPYSYSNPEASSLINSNRRPALSLSDLGRYQKTDKQRSLPTDTSSYFQSSNTLFENVPLPPIEDDNKDDFDLKDIKDETESSLKLNDNKDEKQNNIRRLPIVGDITKDNKRRIVIPLRYRNKRRRTNTKSEEPKGEEDKDDDIENHSNESNDLSNVLINKELSSTSDPSIQISISDLVDETTTTTQRPTIITSSTTIDDKVPAFVLNLKDKFEMMENEKSQMQTTLHNIDKNDTIRDPLALPLTADDLENWGDNNLFSEDEDIKANKENMNDNSY